MYSKLKDIAYDILDALDLPHKNENILDIIEILENSDLPGITEDILRRQYQKGFKDGLDAGSVTD